MKNNHLYLLTIISLFFFGCQPTEKSPGPKNEATSTKEKSIAVIGSYTQKEGHVDGKGAGVSIYETGLKAKDWKLLSTFSDIINPSYICLSPRHPIIYAVSEQGPNVPEPKSVIKVIQYDESTYQMKELQSISALGDAPCYISTDRTGHYLFVANYVSGNVVQYNIKADGTLNPGISNQNYGKGPHDRQESPHLHYIKQHRSNNNIYSVDLGADLIRKYTFNGTGLSQVDSISVTSGAGPRHLVWHPNGKTTYILNELNGTIEAWNWDESTKDHLQTITLIPEGNDGYAGSADIHLSPHGQFVYTTIRGDFDEILVLKVDAATKKLEIIQRLPAGGTVPRNFNVMNFGNYLAVASQNSDRIVLFATDKATGMLSERTEIVEVKTPVCVQER